MVMYVKEKIATIYKIIILIVSGIGLYLNFLFMPIEKSIIYFTIQSNILVFVYYTIFLLEKITKKNVKNSIHYVAKSMIVMAITFTMIGYFLMYLKNGTAQVYVSHELTSIFLHVVTPLLVIFDYFLFDEKGHVKREYIFLWSLLLVAYLVFDRIFIYLGGTYANGKTYPYVFMNADKFGQLGVVINCVLIYIICILFGTAVKLVDNKLNNRK